MVKTTTRDARLGYAFQLQGRTIYVPINERAIAQETQNDMVRCQNRRTITSQAEEIRERWLKKLNPTLRGYQPLTEDKEGLEYALNTYINNLKMGQPYQTTLLNHCKLEAWRVFMRDHVQPLMMNRTFQKSSQRKETAAGVGKTVAMGAAIVGLGTAAVLGGKKAIDAINNSSDLDRETINAPKMVHHITQKEKEKYTPSQQGWVMDGEEAVRQHLKQGKTKTMTFVETEDLHETDLTPLSPWGLILKKRVNLTTTQAYQTGMIEIQDEGSQLLALATNVQANEAVLDYCSGAGGKSLALGQMMQNKGIIVAHDVSSISLKKLQVRAKRAGLSIIQTTQHPTGEFDHVVVDAPCSGTGTWRRQPDAPFKLTEKQMKHYVNQQKKILDKVVKFVKSKGYLHYMTCSLMESENHIQMRAFLHRHKDFRLIHHSQFTPAKHHTDGFFIATFQKQ